jgi:hypothetical protein
MRKIYRSVFFIFPLFVFSLSDAQTTIQTFNYTGAMQTFVVPVCVTSIDLDVIGAQGGGDNSVGGPGGMGGRVEARMSVTPGQTLNIFVGGQGDLTGTPGYNGGGAGANGSAGSPGGGGGGASDIRINGTALSDRVIVAGGGGGGTENGGAAPGGNGGGLIGQDGNMGDNLWGCTGLTAATGGTQTTGGLAGVSSGCSWNGNDGVFGIGGDTYPLYRSAGGGGGWYGGGGAHNGGGGAGGSSYTDPSMTNIIHTQGYQSSDGIVILTYAPGPATPDNISGPAIVCIGSTPTYSISPVATATSYTWSVPAGTTINSGQGSTAINITPGGNSGIISVTASSSCGTSSASTYSMTLAGLPTVTATSTSSAVCTGSNVTLTGNGAVSYVWDNSVTDGISFAPAATATYIVTGTDANGCTNTATTTVVVNPNPTVTGSAANNVVCLDDIADVLTGNPPSGIWTGPGITGSSFDPMTAGSGLQTVTYTYTDSNGCSDTSDVNIQVNLCTAVVENNSGDGIQVFPNPNNGSFTLSVKKDLGAVQIEILDLQGRVVFSEEKNVNSDFAETISMDTVADGIYLLQLTSDGLQQTEKISIQK